MSTDSRFVKLQHSIGRLFIDQGSEVALGLIKLGNISHEEEKNIGVFIQEIGHMLSNKHNDDSFELKEEYLKAEYLEDNLHMSMIGFHSYHLVEVVQYLMEGQQPEEAIGSVKFKHKMKILS